MSLFESVKRWRRICGLLKQGKHNSLLKVNMNHLSKDYQNVSLKKQNKCGWIETPYQQKELLRKPHASLVVIGDSIVADLRCYPTFWRTVFSRYKTINVGIGGDRAESIVNIARSISHRHPNIKVIVSEGTLIGLLKE